MFNILRRNSYSFMVEVPVDFDRFLNPSPEKGHFQVENKISSYYKCSQKELHNTQHKT